MIGIYKIENLINGKNYIGQSIDIDNRWAQHRSVVNSITDSSKKEYPLYRAMKKYGLDNFSFQVIELCSKDELDEKEIYWINYYHTYIKDEQCNGYNLTAGGGGGLSLTLEDIQEIIKLWNNNNFSVGQISAITGYSSSNIYKNLKRFCENYSTEESLYRGHLKNGISHNQPVNQYDLLGNLINSFPSIKIAAEQIGCSVGTIRRILKCQVKCYKGKYYFIYANANQEEELEKHKKLVIPNNQKPVLKLDLNNNIIEIFPSLLQAALSCGTRGDKKIRDCCEQLKDEAYGYKWEYL